MGNFNEVYLDIIYLTNLLAYDLRTLDHTILNEQLASFIVFK